MQKVRLSEFCQFVLPEWGRLLQLLGSVLRKPRGRKGFWRSTSLAHSDSCFGPNFADAALIPKLTGAAREIT